MRKRILIDATTVSHTIDGLTQYILNVMSNFDTTQADFTAIFRRNECPEFYKLHFISMGISIEEVDIEPIGPKRDWHFKQWLALNEQRFDVAFCPSNQFPVAISIPTLYTVHDLIYEEFPEQLGGYSWLKRPYLHWNVSKGLDKAKAVIAVSQYTKSQILKYHPVTPDSKINVIYEGWEHLKNVEPAEIQAPFAHYILYVGSSRGHKNLNRLIDTVASYPDLLPQGWGVVIAGNNKMFTDKQRDNIANVNNSRKKIYLTGWLTNNELAGYMKNADLFIFPSLSEGFGIPILEAYAYKIPLLLSNKASLPEVAADAAIYFNPYDVEDIADAIKKSINADHGQLIQRQTERLANFSWVKTAQQIQQLLLSI